MRDRLIELIRKADKKGLIFYRDNAAELSFANLILDDGWIRPPCKSGDTVYRIVKMSTGVTNKNKIVRVGKNRISGILTPCEPTIKCFVRCVEVTKNNLIDVCENFGKTVFLTREEAEKALKGGADE